MKVKAFITAAGMGKRLGALTQNTNKCLLKIEGKPLIWYVVDRLKKCGLGPVVVATGYQNHALERRLKGKIKPVFNPFYRLCGILGSFWAARMDLDGSAFVFTTSDHFFQESVLKDCLSPGADIRIVIQKKKRYTKEDAKVIIRGLNVVDLGKHIPLHQAHGEFGGMVYFSPRASRLFFRELQTRFEKGELHGYMMELLLALERAHGIPIRYSVCGENARIEVDSVSDLIEARKLAKNFNRRKS